MTRFYIQERSHDANKTHTDDLSYLFLGTVPSRTRTVPSWGPQQQELGTASHSGVMVTNWNVTNI